MGGEVTTRGGQHLPDHLQASTANAASRTGQQVVGELLSFEPRIVIPGSTVIRIKPRQVVRVC